MHSLNLKINVGFNELLEVVRQLSPADKIKLNEVMWNENMDIPFEHQQMVANRRAKSKADPTRMLDWDKAAKTLKP